jgi:hypothetical protein
MPPELTSGNYVAILTRIDAKIAWMRLKHWEGQERAHVTSCLTHSVALMDNSKGHLSIKLSISFISLLP